MFANQVGVVAVSVTAIVFAWKVFPAPHQLAALVEQRVVTETLTLFRLSGVFSDAYCVARLVAAVTSGSSCAPARAAESADACTWRLAYQAKPTSITIAAVPSSAISATIINAKA